MREFPSGATRDTDEGKNDYEGFLSPEVLKRFGNYMTQHRVQADGKIRASDNWQKGISREVYLKSLLRHVIDLWEDHRRQDIGPQTEETLCAIQFNANGYLFEVLHGR